jgi:hypothetical protein
MYHPVEGLNNCGAGDASCCASPEVPEGTYNRSYDGITLIDAGYPAAISKFRLDQYEVTVGRFRQFVAAVVAGWLPGAGTGKHAHLNGGQGLSDTSGGYETGWDSSWSSNLPATASDWTSTLYPWSAAFPPGSRR